MFKLLYMSFSFNVDVRLHTDLEYVCYKLVSSVYTFSSMSIYQINIFKGFFVLIRYNYLRSYCNGPAPPPPPLFLTLSHVPILRPHTHY